jgi:hypothetical protein
MSEATVVTEQHSVGGDDPAHVADAPATSWPASIDLTAITSIDKLRFLTRLAADKRLNATDLRCAIVIADYFNAAKGRAWPSYARLVRDTGASRASVARSIRKLEELGLIYRVGGHSGRSNSYVPDFKAPEPAVGRSQPRDITSPNGETTWSHR